MNLSEKIMMLRKKEGWSQEELANHLQISRQAVSKWESGQSMPDTDKIIQLSQLFHVTTDYLLLDQENEGNIQTGIEISCIPRDLIIVIFYYQISLKPLKTLSLAQVSFPLLFPLCYIVPPVFTNSDKGKYKGKKTDNTL